MARIVYGVSGEGVTSKLDELLADSCVLAREYDRRLGG
jgi:hypothetical protein